MGPAKAFLQPLELAQNGVQVDKICEAQLIRRDEAIHIAYDAKHLNNAPAWAIDFQKAVKHIL
jgi:hypothetical protein